jgi:acetyltransferase
LPDGAKLRVRSLGPRDLARLRRFFYRLSPETVYRRFWNPILDPPPALGRQLLRIDHDRVEALAGFDGNEIVGVVRYAREGESADVAMVVADDWQHRGLSKLLMERLSDMARERGVRAFVAETQADNRPVLSFWTHLDPKPRLERHGNTVQAIIPLQLR